MSLIGGELGWLGNFEFGEAQGRRPVDRSVAGGYVPIRANHLDCPPRPRRRNILQGVWLVASLKRHNSRAFTCSDTGCAACEAWREAPPQAKVSIVRTDACTVAQLKIVWCVENAHRTLAERPKLSDPAHEGVRLQTGRDGRVRCSAWLGDG